MSKVAIGALFCAGAIACAESELVESFPDQFAGVGLELKVESGWPEVIAPLAGGPAASAGLKKGDRIIAIDGSSTKGLSLGDVVVKLRGKPESQVNLQVVRDQTKMIVVVRRQLMKKKAEGYQAVKQ